MLDEQKNLMNVDDKSLVSAIVIINSPFSKQKKCFLVKIK